MFHFFIIVSTFLSVLIKSPHEKGRVSMSNKRRQDYVRKLNEAQRQAVARQGKIRSFFLDVKLLAKTVSKLLKHKSIVFLVLANSIAIGVSNTFAAYYIPMIKPFAPDASDLKLGMLGAVYLIIGEFFGQVLQVEILFRWDWWLVDGLFAG